MKLHIFNPEHDIALAANQECFTAPHAGRRLRTDLGFIPAFWASEGDMVLVDDVESAIEARRHLRKFGNDVVFVTAADLKDFTLDDVKSFQVEPWGWDRTIKEQLLRANKGLEPFMPSDDALATIREMSNRRFAAEHLLPVLREIAESQTVGESHYCTTMEEVLQVLKRNGRSVLKSPWSSSGRGVRYVETTVLDAHLEGWAANVVKRQGGIMVEPLYSKVYDFGLEFVSNSDGAIDFKGLSLFATRGGAYVGNILATEADKREILSRYADIALVDNICERIRAVLSLHFKGIYVGAFGIDMMAVARESADGFLLHPCVELNLRRTMGHLALSLTPTIAEPQRIMSISYADKYRMRIHDTMNNLLNTSLIAH